MGKGLSSAALKLSISQVQSFFNRKRNALTTEENTRVLNSPSRSVARLDSHSDSPAFKRFVKAITDAGFEFGTGKDYWDPYTVYWPPDRAEYDNAREAARLAATRVAPELARLDAEEQDAIRKLHFMDSAEAFQFLQEFIDN